MTGSLLAVLLAVAPAFTPASTLSGPAAGFTPAGPLPVRLPADDCSDCVPGARAAKLCPPHLEAEKEGLEACQAVLKKGDAVARLAALRELAALTEAHANAPSPRVAKTLARGLKDEAPGVVLISIELLGDQHPGAAIDAYADFGKDLIKAFEKANKQASSLNHDIRMRELSADGATKGSARKRQREDQQELRDLEEQLGELERIAEALGPRLGALRDDRIARVLVELSEQTWNEPVAAALSRMGTRAAAERLHEDLDTFLFLYGSAERFRDLVEEDADRFPDTNPEEHRERAAQLERQARAHHDLLTALATEAGLTEGLPEFSSGARKAWDAWYEASHKELPRSVGRMKMPWDA